MTYFERLMLRLAVGASRLPEGFRQRHAAFLSRAQHPDGGFAGRRGASDPYYTAFALRGLALLDSLSDRAAGRAAEFLRRRLDDETPVVDFFSLVAGAVLLEAVSGIDVFAAAGRDRTQPPAPAPTDSPPDGIEIVTRTPPSPRRERLEMVTKTLKRFRRDDGGYAKTEGGRHTSTYHTFLAVACLEMVGAPVDDAPQIIRLIRSRQRDDGGFVELAPLSQSGTNPTAAALATLRLLGAVDASTRETAGAFLAGMQNAEGGLRANTRIPVADLLSTFTGLVAWADLEAGGAVDLDRARRYVEALQQPDGGFRGGAWDDAADVEYTFYGLGTLALLAVLDREARFG